MGERGNYEYHHGKAGPKVHKITDIPEAVFLNGMTTLPSCPDVLLIGDADVGVVHRVNALTGASSIAIDIPAFKPNASIPIPLGVNGIHVRPQEPDYLYFTNSFKQPIFSRVPIDPVTGTQTGPVEAIVQRAPYATNLGYAADDFTFDTAGHAWIATDPSSSLVEVSIPDGEVEIIAGGAQSSVLAGPTASQFGRTAEDEAKGTLFITTNGGIAFPPAMGIVGGKLMALDTAKL